MRIVADVGFVGRSVTKHDCPMLMSGAAFAGGCNVSKHGELVDCGTRPGAGCHVKDATVTFNRMGDMGKLPTSAWLLLWKGGGVRELLAAVCRAESSPTSRAGVLVDRFAQVHRVGRKLATMFVSALSTPVLAPGLTPWYPEVDGNELVVIDTNVARAVDLLRAAGATNTYDAREQWLREQAAQLDLREFSPDLPRYSPRFVQQALYAFCSKSNRIAQHELCCVETSSSSSCSALLCPFVAKHTHAQLTAARIPHEHQ